MQPRTEAKTEAETEYNTDFFQWTQSQAFLLRQGYFSKVDVINLAEEIDSMGKNHHRALESYLSIIMMHLLKWRYQPDHRSASWEGSIDNSRYRIQKLLKESPSLKREVPPTIEIEYPQARKSAGRETGLPIHTFPEQCPFTMAQILEDHWPD